jgi:hypothetical protein
MKFKKGMKVVKHKDKGGGVWVVSQFFLNRATWLIDVTLTIIYKNKLSQAIVK